MDKYNSIEKIKKFLLSEAVNTYYLKANELALKKKGLHYNYIGVNYRNEVADIKLYFTFFDRIEIGEITALKLLPKVDEYIKFSRFYMSNGESVNSWQNTGLTFSIKMSETGKIRTGFHVRGRGFSKNELYIPPKHIVMSELDLQNYQGIYFEYEEDITFRKNYYYISDTKTKLQLAEIFQNNDILAAEIVEYTESELGNKVILWENLTKKYLSLGIRSSADGWLKHTVGLQVGFDGVYEKSNKKARYYSAPFNVKKGLIPLDTYSFLKSYIKQNSLRK